MSEKTVDICMTAEAWHDTVKRLRAGECVPGMCLCMSDDLDDVCIGLIVDGVIGAKIPRPVHLVH
jgi:hypothetical protein